MNHITSCDGILTSLWITMPFVIMFRKRRQPATSVDGMLCDHLHAVSRQARGLRYLVKQRMVTADQLTDFYEQLQMANLDVVVTFEEYRNN